MIIFKNNENKNESRVERIEASVKWYNPAKGYGFLIRENNPADIIIHVWTGGCSQDIFLLQRCTHVSGL